MSQQTTDTLLMIRPVNFRMNEETAVNNYYQRVLEGITADEIRERSRNEFDAFVAVLRNAGVQVIVMEDTSEPETPDSIFPNNWVSFHSDGRVGLYPMYAVNRRLERRKDILDSLEESFGFSISSIEDLSGYEDKGLFLEGTGSMVLDRENKLAYAAISERTDVKVFQEFCDRFDYQPIFFKAFQTVDGQRLPIYHTNVMMCVADQFVVICADSIDDPAERSNVLASFEKAKKEVIYISEEQKHRFAGNMLQVQSHEDASKKYLVMSEAAFTSLNDSQIKTIQKYCPILHSSLDTIEALGGGSARCMMAEVFLPKNN